MNTVKTFVKSDRFFDVINIFLLSLMMLIVAYPLILVVSSSFSDPFEVLMGRVWLLPKKISVAGYQLILERKELWIGYRNTIFYAVFGTAVNLFLTVITAYPLSQKEFYIRKPLMLIYSFTMYFGGGLIPTYFLVKNLGMLDSVWSMIIPGAVSIWNVIIARTFFQSSIPGELKEACLLDGCSEIQYLVKVVLPLSAPILAVLLLFYVVGHWNEYFSAMIYLKSRDKFPLQLFLREILVLSQMEKEMASGMDAASAAEKLKLGEAIKYGVIIVSSLPVLVLYPFLQRFFVKGIMVGSLKG
jgi:putative aldouronate transport system permease protein